MVTDRRLTSESFPMDTNKTGFKWFTKLSVCPHAREWLMLQKVMESNILNSKANHSIWTAFEPSFIVTFSAMACKG